METLVVHELQRMEHETHPLPAVASLDDCPVIVDRGLLPLPFAVTQPAEKGVLDELQGLRLQVRSSEVHRLYPTTEIPDRTKKSLTFWKSAYESSL